MENLALMFSSVIFCVEQFILYLYKPLLIFKYLVCQIFQEVYNLMQNPMPERPKIKIILIFLPSDAHIWNKD